MKSIFSLLFLTLVAFVSQAQNESFKGDRFIEVTGIAHQEIEPNEIYMLIRLREFESNKEKTSLEDLDKDFLKALKDAGIDKKRLELADAGTNLGKFGKKGKDAFRDKSYQLKLTSAAELEIFLEKMQAVKLDFLDITKLSHSDLEKIKVDLKTKALQAALNKADYLLKSIGAQVGKPLMVRDWEMDPIQPMMEYKANVRMQSADDAFDPEQPIAFRKIKLQAQIVAQFEIK
ncbi:MAG TPA: SIMPL domain-containing protein [Chryseosolibacter sp.]|nr:SIMPL domain-containing protein [Chryseosolibacter sp.]